MDHEALSPPQDHHYSSVELSLSQATLHVYIVTPAQSLALALVSKMSACSETLEIPFENQAGALRTALEASVSPNFPGSAHPHCSSFLHPPYRSTSKSTLNLTLTILLTPEILSELHSDPFPLCCGRKERIFARFRRGSPEGWFF